VDFETTKTLLEELVPLHKHIGLQLTSLKDGMAETRFDFKPELLGNIPAGILHGGIISTVMDVTGAMALVSLLAHGKLTHVGTVDMRVDFLRPGKGKRFVCTGHVLRNGKTLGTTRTELVNEKGDVLATGNQVYRIHNGDKPLTLDL